MHGHGRVDRSGGREGKKSLRKNKQAICDSIKKANYKTSDEKQPESAPAPPIEAAEHETPLIDCSCHLLNRNFENDQLKVIRRAKDSGVIAMLVTSTDVDKIDACVKLCVDNSGSLYCIVGVHPDAIKRANEKVLTQKMESIEEVALKPEVAGILSGLDYSRDIATRYHQERFLEGHIKLADSVRLPLVLHVVGEGAPAKVLELIAQHASAEHRLPLALFDFRGSPESIQSFAEYGAFFIVTGSICEEGEPAEAARSLVRAVPRSSLVVASNSPFCTPANIPDPWIRQNRNEPANLPYVSQRLASLLDLPPAEVAALTVTNAKALFGLSSQGDIAPAITEGATVTSQQPSLRSQHPVAEPEDVSEVTKSPPPVPVIEQPKVAKVPEKRVAASHAKQPAPPPEARKEATSVTGPMADLAVSSAKDAQASTSDTSNKDSVEFRCKLCGEVLFGPGQIVPHQSDAPGTSLPDGAARQACFVLFVRPTDWINAQVEPLEDCRLDCPGCNAKLGRHTPSGIQCSCGYTERQWPYKIGKSRVDMVLTSGSLEDLTAANLRLYEELIAYQDTEEQQEEQLEANRRALEQERKARKKVTKVANSANFSNFRNKNYAAAPSKRSSDVPAAKPVATSDTSFQE